MVGISVNETTHGTAIANLGWTRSDSRPRCSRRHDPRGNRGLELRESKSRPNAGIVTFLQSGLNQKIELVAQCSAVPATETSDVIRRNEHDALDAVCRLTLEELAKATPPARRPGAHSGGADCRTQIPRAPMSIWLAAQSIRTNLWCASRSLLGRLLRTRARSAAAAGIMLPKI